jgi:molecular chaperone DnaK
LRSLSAASADLQTHGDASVGDEIRLEILDERSQLVSVGLATVTAIDPGESLRLHLVALGVDPALLASLQRQISGEPAALETPDPFAPDLGWPEDESPTASRPAGGGTRPAGATATESVPLTGITIGIDLGTTNTCAAYSINGKVQIIPGRTGTNTIPSMITFDPDGRWHVGQRAADRQILYPLRTVYGSKRLVGRTYRPELAQELQQHFAYPLDKAEGQRFGARIDDRVISMDTIAARVLDEVRSTAEEHLKRPVDAAVITVPAYFTEVQREAVRRAAKEANLTVRRIVNEPTAAAVAYGHKQGQRARIAVWDFGGGTFDFSVVDVADGKHTVLSTGGDNFIGGSDFDDLLASFLLTEFCRIEQISFDPTPQQIARLREAAEQAKRALSVESEHLVELPDFSTSPRHHLRVEVTRFQFEAMTQPLLLRALAIAEDVLEDVNLLPQDIDDVLLVGGTTRIPAVEQAVARLFGRRPSKRINPDEAVAIGAALLAEESKAEGAPTLIDVLPMSIGFGAPGLRFIPMAPRNTRLPTAQERTFDADVLGNVTIALFQGEATDVTQNEYLCSVIVEDRSLWDNGRVTLRISFDEHCVMSVSARNARTDHPLPARLDRTRAVGDILRELGQSDEHEPPPPPIQKPPPSLLGKALGKLFRAFQR